MRRHVRIEALGRGRGIDDESTDGDEARLTAANAADGFYHAGNARAGRSFLVAIEKVNPHGISHRISQRTVCHGFLSNVAFADHSRGHADAVLHALPA
jgi:hypothetical protein